MKYQISYRSYIFFNQIITVHPAVLFDMVWEMYFDSLEVKPHDLPSLDRLSNDFDLGELTDHSHRTYSYIAGVWLAN